MRKLISAILCAAAAMLPAFSSAQDWATVRWSLGPQFPYYSNGLSNLSANGQIVATVASSFQLDIWDYPTSTLLYSLPLPSYYPTAVAVSPDGTEIVYTYNNRLLELNTFTGSIAWNSEASANNTSINAVVFSPDGSCVYYCTSTGLVGKMSNAGRVSWLKPVSNAALNCIAVSPNGTELALGGQDTNVWLVDTATGTQKQSLVGHTEEVNCIAFGPNTVYSGGSSDQTVRRWNATNGAPIGSPINMGGGVWALALNSDGSSFACAFEGGVNSYNSSGTLLKTSTEYAYHLVFTPDKTTLIAGSDGAGEYKKLKTSDLSYAGGFGLSDGSYPGLAWSADESAIFTGAYEACKWGALDGHQISRSTLAYYSNSIATSANGSLTAYGEYYNAIELVTNSSGNGISLTDSPTMGYVESVAFTADSTKLVSASNDPIARVWSSTGTILEKINTGSNNLKCVAVTGAGATTPMIATGDVAGNISLWNANTYAHISTFPSVGSPITKLLFSKDASIVIAASGEDVIEFYSNSGTIHRRIIDPDNSTVYDMDLEPNGQYFCTISDGNYLNFWSLSGGPEFSTFVGAASATAVRFSPKGDLIALLTVGYGDELSVIGDPLNDFLTAIVPESFGAMGGNTVKVRAYLATAAPSAGALIALYSNTPYLTVPKYVFVPANQSYADFTVSAATTAAPVQATILGGFRGDQTTAPLVVLPPILSRVDASTPTVTSGTTLTLTVTLEAAAPSSGAVVYLTSSNSHVTVPATVTIPAGAKTANVTVSTTAVTAAVQVTLGATYNKVNRLTTISLIP